MHWCHECWNRTCSATLLTPRFVNLRTPAGRRRRGQGQRSKRGMWERKSGSSGLLCDRCPQVSMSMCAKLLWAATRGRRFTAVLVCGPSFALLLVVRHFIDPHRPRALPLLPVHVLRILSPLHVSFASRPCVHTRKLQTAPPPPPPPPDSYAALLQRLPWLEKGFRGMASERIPAFTLGYSFCLKSTLLLVCPGDFLRRTLLAPRFRLHWKLPEASPTQHRVRSRTGINLPCLCMRGVWHRSAEYEVTHNTVRHNRRADTRVLSAHGVHRRPVPGPRARGSGGPAAAHLLLQLWQHSRVQDPQPEEACPCVWRRMHARLRVGSESERCAALRRLCYLATRADPCANAE